MLGPLVHEGRDGSGTRSRHSGLLRARHRGQPAAGGARGGRLELERNKELVLRRLPDGLLNVLDVGGGAGVYARWLIGRGHNMRLIDPGATSRRAGVGSRRSVRSRRRPPVGCRRRLGRRGADARPALSPSQSFRSRGALCEAHRVLRSGGVVVAAAISRFTALLDLLVRHDTLDASNVPGMIVGKRRNVDVTAPPAPAPRRTRRVRTLRGARRQVGSEPRRRWCR